MSLLQTQNTFIQYFYCPLSTHNDLLRHFCTTKMFALKQHFLKNSYISSSITNSISLIHYLFLFQFLFVFYSIWVLFKKHLRFTGQITIYNYDSSDFSKNIWFLYLRQRLSEYHNFRLSLYLPVLIIYWSFLEI